MAPGRSISTFGSSMSFSFKQALKAVKSKLPSSVRKVSFNATRQPVSARIHVAALSVDRFRLRQALVVALLLRFVLAQFERAVGVLLSLKQRIHQKNRT